MEHCKSGLVEQLCFDAHELIRQWPVRCENAAVTERMLAVAIAAGHSHFYSVGAVAPGVNTEDDELGRSWLAARWAPIVRDGCHGLIVFAILTVVDALGAYWSC